MTLRVERKLVVVGVGRVGAQLASYAPADWSVTVVDVHPATAAGVLPGREVRRVVGDASSRLVLERCGLGPAVTLVAATGDDAVNREVARLAHDAFGVQDLVVVLGDGDAPVPAAQVVSRSRALVQDLRGRIVGLDEGAGGSELRYVTILPGSPAIGQRLRDLHRGDWLVALVYRGAEIVVPRGETALREGDRLLIAGQPDDLSTVALFLRGGQPTFPAAWGARVGFTSPEVEAAASWLVARTTASEAIAIPNVLDVRDDELEATRDRLIARDVGCLVLPGRPVSWLARVGVVRCAWADRAHHFGVPLLLVRSAGSPERVVVALGAEQDPRAIGMVGVDLARQSGVPLVFLSILPSAISPESSHTVDPSAEAVRLARLHGIEPQRVVERGNPIERIRAQLRPSDLLVAGHAPATRNSLLTPDVSLFLLHATPCSALFVPWRRPGAR